MPLINKKLKKIGTKPIYVGDMNQNLSKLNKLSNYNKGKWQEYKHYTDFFKSNKLTDGYRVIKGKEQEFTFERTARKIITKKNRKLEELRSTFSRIDTLIIEKKNKEWITNCKIIKSSAETDHNAVFFELTIKEEALELSESISSGYKSDQNKTLIKNKQNKFIKEIEELTDLREAEWLNRLNSNSSQEHEIILEELENLISEKAIKNFSKGGCPCAMIQDNNQHTKSVHNTTDNEDSTESETNIKVNQEEYLELKKLKKKNKTLGKIISLVTEEITKNRNLKILNENKILKLSKLCCKLQCNNPGSWGRGKIITWVSEKRKMRNITNNRIKKLLAKARYTSIKEKIKNIQDEHINDPKKYWKKIQAGNPTKNNQKYKRSIKVLREEINGKVNKFHDIKNKMCIMENFYTKLFQSKEKNLNNYKNFQSPKYLKKEYWKSGKTNTINKLTKSIKFKEVNEWFNKKRKKKFTSPGEDEITYTILNLVPERIISIYVKLFNECFFKGTIPEKWKNSILTVIHKGGEKDKVENYRPIALLNVTYKCYTGILNDRLISIWKAINSLTKTKLDGERACPQHATSQHYLTS